jgi:hypothetical protein
VFTYSTQIFNESSRFSNGSSDLFSGRSIQPATPHRTSRHSSPRPTESSDKLAPYNQQQRPCDLSGLTRFFVKGMLSLLDGFGYHTRIKMGMLSLLDSFGYHTRIKINWTRSVSVLWHFKNDDLQKITTWNRKFPPPPIIAMKRSPPLMSKYFPSHHILNYPQPMFFP